MENPIQDDLPKSRKDFGYKLDQVIEKVLLRVKKKYPKEQIDKLLKNGKKKKHMSC